MSTFSDLLASVGLAPKTLPQAKETIDTAKATLDSVAALFTAADLNLEQMLAAGPESLKAHLDSLDNGEELAEALQQNEALEKQVSDYTDQVADLGNQLATADELLSAIGLSPLTSDHTPEQAKSAFSDHVSKQVTLALAKTGHPPAHVPTSAEAAPGATPTGAELHAQWKAMKPSPERLAFFSKNEAAITAFERKNT